MSPTGPGWPSWNARGPVSATQRWREELGDIIEHLHKASNGTYGYRRFHADLGRAGRHCHPDTVPYHAERTAAAASGPRQAMASRIDSRGTKSRRDWSYGRGIYEW